MGSAWCSPKNGGEASSPEKSGEKTRGGMELALPNRERDPKGVEKKRMIWGKDEKKQICPTAKLVGKNVVTGGWKERVEWRAGKARVILWDWGGERGTKQTVLFANGGVGEENVAVSWPRGERRVGRDVRGKKVLGEKNVFTCGKSRKRQKRGDKRNELKGKWWGGAQKDARKGVGGVTWGKEGTGRRRPGRRPGRTDGKCRLEK